MQEFPIFKICKFMKITKFSKFSQNLSFSKEKVATNYIKNHFKKIGWNRGTHGSEFGYGWMFSQIFTPNPKSVCNLPMSLDVCRFSTDSDSQKAGCYAYLYS
jgi:hypothetical protein